MVSVGVKTKFRSILSIKNRNHFGRAKSSKKQIESQKNYVPSPKVRGGHISFSSDPVRRRDMFVSTKFLESVGGILPDLHGYITGTSQRAD